MVVGGRVASGFEVTSMVGNSCFTVGAAVVAAAVLVVAGRATSMQV